MWLARKQFLAHKREVEEKLAAEAKLVMEAKAMEEARIAEKLKGEQNALADGEGYRVLECIKAVTNPARVDSVGAEVNTHIYN